MKCLGYSEGACQDLQCRYNLFEGIKESNRHPTDETDRMRNCVLRVDRPWTLEEIAQIWGLSRERVRQIEEKAIERLVLKLPDYFYGMFDLTAAKVAKRKHEAREFLRDGRSRSSRQVEI